MGVFGCVGFFCWCCFLGLPFCGCGLFVHGREKAGWLCVVEIYDDSIIVLLNQGFLVLLNLCDKCFLSSI